MRAWTSAPAAAVEHYLADSGGFRALGNGLADHFGRRNISATLEVLFRFAVHGTRRDESFSGAVVDHLRVDVSQRTVDAKTRTLGSALDALAYAFVNAEAVKIF